MRLQRGAGPQHAAQQSERIFQRTRVSYFLLSLCLEIIYYFWSYSFFFFLPEIPILIAYMLLIFLLQGKCSAQQK